METIYVSSQLGGQGVTMIVTSQIDYALLPETREKEVKIPEKEEADQAA